MRIGIIEGFYGRPYRWAQRRALVPFLADHGYDFYIYAPKSESRLRSRWREPFEDLSLLSSFAEHCRANGLAFGVGLSPLGLHEDFEAGREALARRLDELAFVDLLAALFDDMRGDLPDLARTQGEIATFVVERYRGQVVMCPSYYTTSPILDKIFGPRPESYLEDLGQALPTGVDVFWTGEKVCSTSYPAEHLEEVSHKLGRKPFLWDNYPVNDGPRMCKRLHLAHFTERGPHLREHCSGLAVNPMNECWLSRIPLATLARNLDGQPADALAELLPPDLERLLRRDMERFVVPGLDELPVEELALEYGAIEHPAAREVTAWLRGEYTVGPECLTDT